MRTLLAPLPEQRAIVAKIEELFSDLDKGVADLKKAQDQLKVYRQAVLKKAVEGDWKKVELESACDKVLKIKRKEMSTEKPLIYLDIGAIDNTKNVRRALEEVKETIFISFALVVLVIFFFFRNWLIAIRPLVDIPISLIATFFIMYLAGFSINILTLLAIVLATGLVVDDGIVVTENIFRKLEEGLNLKDAAREGSKEIFFAVIST